MRRVTISLLGPFEVTIDGAPVTGFTYAKVRALLAYLALETGSHPRAQLAALLWPDLPERTARGNLSQALTTLRHALGDTSAQRPALLTDAQSVQLAHDGPLDVDVLQFLASLRDAEAHPHGSWRTCALCDERLRQALDLYRGSFLADLAVSDSEEFEAWASLQREQLVQRMLSTLQRLFERAQWCGADLEALTYARRLVALEPWLERNQRAFMRLLVLNGETDAALAQYRQLQTILDQELAATPEAATTALVDQIRRGETAGLQPPQPPFVVPLPPSPLVGRSAELQAICARLRDLSGRALTITGTGGTGKTRLAIEAAHALRYDFEDGVYVVELAALNDAALLADAVARVLGVPEQPQQAMSETLREYLRSQHLLLVLDNFEHVIVAAPLVGELLAACPTLTVLVTSREALRLAREHVYPLRPLTLPLANTVSAQDLAASEAGALFVRRARMAVPHFEASDDTAPDIARICIRLDGLPLAIELAAARCKLLTPQTLLARLETTMQDAPLQVLAGGSRDVPARHRTLRNTIAWSYNLLEADEQALFARLAVFRGGCSLDAAQAVCGTERSIDVLDGLEALVDKSLVQQKAAGDGESRFGLLELIRAYAHDRLDAICTTATIHRRHAEYFVALAERAEPELRRARYDHWCQVFERELENIRAALDWTLSAGDVTLGVRLAGALGLFWFGTGHHVEGIRWTRRLLERLDEAPVAHHAKFLISAGHLAWLHDLDAAQRLFVRALDIARTLGDTLQTAWALTFLAYTKFREPAAALPIGEEALASFRALQHQPGIAQALNIVGQIARASGDTERARRAYEECLEVCQATGERRRICYMYGNLAFLAQHAGDDARAMQLGRQCLVLARDGQSRRDKAEALITIAGSLGIGSATQAARLRRAAHLLGASEAALERIGGLRNLGNRPEYDRIVAGVRAQLDDAAFGAAWAEGRSMTLEQAIAYALSLSE